MTRYEIELGEVVLRGVPRGYADGLASLIEERLAELAAVAEMGALAAHGAPDRLGSSAPDGLPGWSAPDGSPGRTASAVDGPGALADVVARRVWAAIERKGAAAEPTRAAAEPTRPALQPTRPAIEPARPGGPR